MCFEFYEDENKISCGAFRNLESSEGKPVEKQGRKSSGLKRMSVTVAGLPMFWQAAIGLHVGTRR